MTTLVSPELKELEGKINHRQTTVAQILAEAKSGGDNTIDLSKVTTIAGTSAEKAAALKALNDELADFAGQADALRSVMQIAAGQIAAEAKGSTGIEQGAATGAVDTKARSIGEQFVKSASWAGRVSSGDSPSSVIDIDVKTLLQRSTGFPNESTRSDLVVDFATRPVQVTDLVPSMPWGQGAYKYMEETTFTNGAVETAEAATYGESAFAWTERSVPLEKVTVWIPVTDEQLEDVAFLEAKINSRLAFQLAQRVDLQLLVGNGTTPNLTGINNKSGIQTQARGTDPNFDAVLKAAVLIQTVGFAQPNAVIMNPTNWQTTRLLRTADGIYILGNPQDVAPMSLWGMRVVPAVAQTLNTAVVGDFANFSELLIRRGLEVKVSNSHGTFFVEGKQAIRADMRLAAVWTRAAAFCTVTSLL